MLIDNEALLVPDYLLRPVTNACVRYEITARTLGTKSPAFEDLNVVCRCSLSGGDDVPTNDLTGRLTSYVRREHKPAIPWTTQRVSNFAFFGDPHLQLSTAI